MSRETIPTPLLLTPEEASAILGRTLEELRQWRDQNTGPTFHRLGSRLIRYSRAAVAQCVNFSIGSTVRVGNEILSVVPARNGRDRSAQRTDERLPGLSRAVTDVAAILDS